MLVAVSCACVTGRARAVVSVAERARARAYLIPSRCWRTEARASRSAGETSGCAGGRVLQLLRARVVWVCLVRKGPNGGDSLATTGPTHCNNHQAVAGSLLIIHWRRQILVARFDTGHGNLEDVRGDPPAVEQWFLRLHYRRLPHVHLLVANGVQYGARGFVGLQREVCDVRHPKGNENGRSYIFV